MRGTSATTFAPRPVAGDTGHTRRSVVPQCVRDLRNLTKTVFDKAEEVAVTLDRDGGQVTYQVLRGAALDEDPVRDPQRDPLSKRRASLSDLAHDPEALEALRLLKLVAKRYFGIVWH